MKILWQTTIPCKTVSESNVTEHWSKRAARHKIQRQWIEYYFCKEQPKIDLPCIIKLSRIATHRLDDDNLTGALKHIRDVIANILIPGKRSGQADSDPRLKWEYSQEKLDKGQDPAVQITIYQE